MTCFQESNHPNIQLRERILNDIPDLWKYVLYLQEQTKLDTTKQVISPEECDDLSPMPHSQVPPVRRRGGISAEPVTEEDATSYVKKVK